MDEQVHTIGVSCRSHQSYWTAILNSTGAICTGTAVHCWTMDEQEEYLVAKLDATVAWAKADPDM